MILRIKTTVYLFLPILYILHYTVYSQQNDSIASSFELSFGQSTLFISNKKHNSIKSNFNIVIPTSSMLFFIEFRPLKKIKIPIALNLPTESKQYLVNGKLINEKAFPTLATGTEIKAFDFKIPFKAKIEINLGMLGSIIMRNNYQITFAPLITNRFSIIKNNSFIMYLGGSYSVGINTFGMFYGTGYVF